MKKKKQTLHKKKERKKSNKSLFIVCALKEERDERQRRDDDDDDEQKRGKRPAAFVSERVQRKFSVRISKSFLFFFLREIRFFFDFSCGGSECFCVKNTRRKISLNRTNT